MYRGETANTKHIAAPPHSMCKCCGDGASPLGEVEDVMSQQSGKSPHQGLVALRSADGKKRRKGRVESKANMTKRKAAGSP